MIGSKIIELERIDSTNDYVNEILSQADQPHGLVVSATEQYAGKGQHNNRWDSAAGKNLTFTVLLKPRFIKADQQFMLNKAVALGVADFVVQTDIPEVSIKWPNDIYAGDRKIGGILIEHRIMGDAISISLAGIGLNINQTEFSPDLPNPVSMIQLTQHEWVLKDALEAVCLTLNRRYSALERLDFGLLDNDFNHRLLGFNQWREYHDGKTNFEGRITGVDKMGCLIIEKRNGRRDIYAHKEVCLML